MIDLAAHKTAGKPSLPETVLRFVERLKELDRGELAALKRNAGRTIAESRNTTGPFYRILPPEIAGQRHEEIYFLVSTLYGLNPKSHDGDLGSTLRLVKTRTQSDSVDRRMAMLLDSEFGMADGFHPGGGEMAYRLRQCIKLAAGHEVGIDWPRLLTDLLWWSHPGKRVQKQWARSYYGAPENEEKPAGAGEEE